jgi:hypothetical protein
MLNTNELINQSLHNTSAQLSRLGFSPRRELLTFVLLSAALFLALVGAAPALYAQEKAAKTPATLAAQLGLKARDLTAKGKPDAYQDNPAAEGDSLAGLAAAATAAASNMVGTMSVQDFQGMQLNLSNTHASADGFRNYFTTWYTPNFARKDAGVSAWLYRDIANGDNFDIWTDSTGTDLGMDAVRVGWHSGHGGMSSTNVFFAPLGANWGNRGWNAFSNQMFLGGNNFSYGDERLRYMFWDTCQSVKVSDGNNPYATWGTRSKGVRMVFGYETNSLDSGDYGKFFWEEWNKGKTLASAFLDASLRVNRGTISGSSMFSRQTPVVVAFGANQSEARGRINGERYLYAEWVSNNWAEWSWLTPRSAALAASVNLLDSPEQDLASRLSQIGIREVAPKSNSDKEVAELAQAIGIKLPDASLIEGRPFGLRAVRANGASLVVERNGNFELSIKPTLPQGADGEVIADEELIARAQKIAEQLSAASGLETRVGLICDLNENGGTEDFQGTPRVVAKTIIFDQVIDGIPFVDAEAGHLEISFEARSGQVTRVRSTLQQLAPASETSLASSTPKTISEARAAALKAFAASAKQEAAQQTLEIVPESEEVGYQVIDGKAVPVYKALVRNTQFPTARPQQAIIPLLEVK